MWIKAQNGNFYRREAFFMIDVESVKDGGIQHNYLRARLTPPPAGASLSGLKAVDPGAVVLGEYASPEQARQALARLFPERSDVVNLTLEESR